MLKNNLFGNGQFKFFGKVTKAAFYPAAIFKVFNFDIYHNLIDDSIKDEMFLVRTSLVNEAIVCMMKFKCLNNHIVARVDGTYYVRYGVKSHCYSDKKLKPPINSDVFYIDGFYSWDKIWEGQVFNSLDDQNKRSKHDDTN